MFGFKRYQWLVLLAAWLGWGFDVFDGLLFNYVAPNCVPTLLGLTIGSPEAKHATLQWTGILTSVLLLGWAAGGVLFGKIGDRIGRTKTLLITMLLYAVGTAACALAPNIWVLGLFRLVAALGIGGEWAAGAAMVAPASAYSESGAAPYSMAAYDSAPSWFADGEPRAALGLIDLLVTSRVDGLDPSQFNIRALQRAVRRAGDDVLIVADGTSCRHQIHDGAQREAVHAAVLLAAQL